MLLKIIFLTIKQVLVCVDLAVTARGTLAAISD